MNRLKVRNFLSTRPTIHKMKDLTDEQIMEEFENIDDTTLEELNDDFNKRLVILLTHSGLNSDTIDYESLGAIRYILGLMYTPQQDFTPEERSELLEHVRIVEDEIKQELESSILKGGGYREIFVKFMIYLTLITYLGATINNHFVRTHYKELIALRSNNQCGKEMSLYSGVLGMFLHHTVGNVFDISILYEYIPGMKKSVWELSLMTAKLTPQYIAQYLGAQRTCFTRVESINQYFQTANAIWRIYALISMNMYATFIEKSTKRSAIMTYWVYTWRGLFGVGNPVLGPPRLLIEGASTFIEYCSKPRNTRPSLPGFGQFAQPKPQPFSEFGKSRGGKITKRKNKIRKTKKY